jgi:hypothetical protein
MPRFLRPRAIAAALVLAPALVPALAPAAAQVTVLTPSVMERTAARGARYESSIIVRNSTPVVQVVTARVADYSFQADGTSRYDEPGTHPRSNAAWLTLAPRTIEVPPNQTVSLAFSVQVPQGAELAGSYSSMVLVMGKPRQQASLAVGHGRANAGIRSDLSYGIQVVTHLDGPAQARFGMDQIVASNAGDSDRALAFTVRNTGERAQRPVVSLELYTEDGRLVTTQRSQRGLIYPGSSVRQTFALRAVPKGSYRALLQVDTGDDVFALPTAVRF